MAQDTHVTSVIGTLITGENATQSTNPFPFCFGSLRLLDQAIQRAFLYDLGGPHATAA